MPDAKVKEFLSTVWAGIPVVLLFRYVAIRRVIDPYLGKETWLVCKHCEATIPPDIPAIRRHVKAVHPEVWAAHGLKESDS